MKINKYIIGAVFGASVLGVSSCSDFLDHEPDTRTEINDVESVRQLVATSYPIYNYGAIAEWSSDNMVDNNAPHIPVSARFGSKKDTTKVYYNLASYSKMYDELFAFEPVTETSIDSPSAVWEGYYNSIASVNHALENLDRIVKEGNLSAADRAKADACRGEALLIRAFDHFILVNLFSQAYKNEAQSKQDIGIPYVTAPETDLLVEYNRSNVWDTYQKIKVDLEEGLKLVSDAYYKVPKYHFNKSAAYAFAVRFYLFTRDYDNVIKYANLVLGEDPATVVNLLRDRTAFKDLNTTETIVNAWIDVTSPSNLMLLSSNSTLLRALAGGVRYGHNHDAVLGTVRCFGPSWGINMLPAFQTTLYFGNGKLDYGLASTKVGEKFQYTDKVAGVGYPYIIRMEFTTEEVLLSRAEAYLMKGNIAPAMSDLQSFDASLKKIPNPNPSFFYDLTDQRILDFYGDKNSNDLPELFCLDYSNTSKMDPNFVVEQSVRPYLDCVMHFRRIQTLHDGMRFFDLKRFGIEYKHEIGKKEDVLEPERVEYLTWNDERRALEVPFDAISMGLQPSRSTTIGVSKEPLTVVSRDEYEEGKEE